MQYTPAVENFLNCWQRSGLVDERETDALIDGLAQAGVDVRDPKKIAAALVRNETLTKWQAENLLRGKRRGFVLGKYRLLGLLGRGANNSVYIGEHSLMRRRCAIKVLPTKHLSSSSTALSRFQQEARAVALLDHTNIVRAYDLGQDKDGKSVVHFFVMELVDGESFEERVARDGPLPAIDAANLIRQAADGLAHAHKAGIIHRDIKPANLLVDRQEVVKILDLGLAKMSDILSDESPVLGTADFLAPEQALDAKTADARSDVYSLGCTFYFVLCGQPPFSGGTLSERLVRHLFETPVALARKRPDLPPDLTSLVHRMLAKNPNERIQTSEEISSLLRNWLLKHADRQWLRAHPAVLGAGRTDKGETTEAAKLAPSDQDVGQVAQRPAEMVATPPDAQTLAGPATPNLVPVMEHPGAAATFLDSEEFQVPISPVTRSLMKDRPGPSAWRSWLTRASKKLRGA
jgi:tRNA A-37 threonylcarbamoyl transferase component Bud32